jgi:hypothetical protein
MFGHVHTLLSRLTRERARRPLRKFQFFMNVLRQLGISNFSKVNDSDLKPASLRYRVLGSQRKTDSPFALVCSDLVCTARHYSA